MATILLFVIVLFAIAWGHKLPVESYPVERVLEDVRARRQSVVVSAPAPAPVKVEIVPVVEPEREREEGCWLVFDDKNGFSNDFTLTVQSDEERCAEIQFAQAFPPRFANRIEMDEESEYFDPHVGGYCEYHDSQREAAQWVIKNALWGVRVSEVTLEWAIARVDVSSIPLVLQYRNTDRCPTVVELIARDDAQNDSARFCHYEECASAKIAALRLVEALRSPFYRTTPVMRTLARLILEA